MSYRSHLKFTNAVDITLRKGVPYISVSKRCFRSRNLKIWDLRHRSVPSVWV